MSSIYCFQVTATELKLLFSLTAHGGGSWRVIVGVNLQRRAEADLVPFET